MYIDVGDGDEPVLMLHGAGVSGWMWSPTRALLNSAVKTIVPDLPGFGRSASHPYVSHQATVEELRVVIERHAPQGAHVVGFSLGAQLTILLASEVPHLVRSATIISAETKPAPLPGPTLGLLALAAPLSRQRWFAEAQARQLGIPKDLWAEYLRDSATTSRETLLASVSENIRFTLPSTWSDYPGSASILVGARERKLMHDSAGLTSSALPGSTLLTVEGAAHDIPLSDPRVVVSELDRQMSDWRTRP
ncbi:alpha/beta hydrolase [Microbacterium sp. zg-YB36]|uniref:alpha/beta fold hydrolase n=1 Tax=Microbacterium sp. zg-YB36 TaxID=2969407 RepID=UPI00214CB137|nr:alpha/beta hydrolase [Microbacterium sp. zg-YB36]MDL5351070.1 alpha/beta hydrolase [Microbacterium sp. zg-YB36]